MTQSETSLETAVRRALEQYFQDLDGGSCANVYQLVLGEVERPLLEVTLKFAGGNQSRAAKWLGLSRNTLRKLIAKYQLEAVTDPS